MLLTSCKSGAEGTLDSRWTQPAGLNFLAVSDRLEKECLTKTLEQEL